MRIGFMSDLHRELYPARSFPIAADAGARPDLAFGPHGPSLEGLRGRCDVLVIPGDFDNGTRGVEALIAASDYLDVPVVLVAGNHEHYNGKIYKVLRELRAALAGTRVHLLDRDELVLSRSEDGRWIPAAGGSLSSASSEGPGASPLAGSVRFLGATLWTDFAAFGEARVENCLAEALARKNDFKRITVGPEDTGFASWRRLLPRDTLGFHHRDRRWLCERLAEPFAGRTVVVTHMAPSMRSVPEADRNSPVGATYGSHLDSLIEELKPDLWIHGHTHASADYAIGQTRVVCNPLGYWGHETNPQFKADRVIEIETTPSSRGEI